MNRFKSEHKSEKTKLLSLYCYWYFRGEKERAAHVREELKRKGLFNASVLLGMAKFIAEFRAEGRQNISKGELYDRLDEMERNAEQENETRGNN